MSGSGTARDLLSGAGIPTLPRKVYMKKKPIRLIGLSAKTSNFSEGKDCRKPNLERRWALPSNRSRNMKTEPIASAPDAWPP